MLVIKYLRRLSASAPGRGIRSFASKIDRPKNIQTISFSFPPNITGWGGGGANTAPPVGTYCTGFGGESNVLSLHATGQEGCRLYKKHYLHWGGEGRAVIVSGGRKGIILIPCLVRICQYLIKLRLGRMVMVAMFHLSFIFMWNVMGDLYYHFITEQ